MQNKIKILHIQETIGSGGVERRRLSLAKHLDKEKFDQKFICTFASGNIPNEIRAEGFEVIPIGQLKSPFDWKQHRKVQKIIEDYQPDIIHGAVFEGVTMAAINGWIKKVPIIIIEETSDPQNRSRKGNLLMKLFSILADKVIGVSEAVTEEYLKSKLNLPDKKVILINNGVAMPRQCNPEEIVRARKKWGIEKNDFVIGTIGQIISEFFNLLISQFYSRRILNYSLNQQAKDLIFITGPFLLFGSMCIYLQNYLEYYINNFLIIMVNSMLFLLTFVISQYIFNREIITEILELRSKFKI